MRVDQSDQYYSVSTYLCRDQTGTGLPTSELSRPARHSRRVSSCCWQPAGARRFPPRGQLSSGARCVSQPGRPWQSRSGLSPPSWQCRPQTVPGGDTWCGRCLWRSTQPGCQHLLLLLLQHFMRKW